MNVGKLAEAAIKSIAIKNLLSCFTGFKYFFVHFNIKIKSRRYEYGYYKFAKEPEDKI